MKTKLYIADTDVLNDEDLFCRLLGMMPGSRRRKILSRRFRSDKNASLAAGVLLLYALKEAEPEKNIQSDKLIIAEKQKGKPYLPDYPGFNFSLSHTDGLAVCLVSGSECGTDVECIKDAPEGVAERFFAADETKYIKKLNGSEKNTGFFRIWTLKESFVKTVGEGLSMGLAGFSVIKNGKILKNYDGKYRFFEVTHDKYEISCCFENGAKRVIPEFEAVDLTTLFF